MQSSAGGPIVNNPPMDLSTFGIRDSESGFGARVEVGDGFSGVGLDYIFLDNETTNNGTLTNDWGNLRAGDTVNTRIKMSNARLRWILGHTWLDDDEEWGAGLGGEPLWHTGG